jgi:LmbE family N-acetylglucosaminyl deacetylase
MIPLRWPERPGGLHVVCLGAHPDDIEIGCGGTVLQLARRQQLRTVTWIVCSGEGGRREEALGAARAFLAGVPHSTVRVERFRDGYFPTDMKALKECLATIARDAAADLVFTHARHDRHQDHRAVAELTWNLWRDQVVLEYEVPKYEGDLVPPNVYVPLDDDVRHEKLRLLLEHFPSQGERRWFDRETFDGLMRLRGVESNAPSRYAEAFHGAKLVLS